MACIESDVTAVLERCPQLHVLVQNAGVVNLRRQQSVDGHEATFAVNHLAPFLLTSLLLGRLVASAPARIVIVGSEAHRFARLDLGDLDSSVHYGAMRVYGTTKLANLLFTYELARRLEGTGVTANCVHPGAVATRLAHNNGVWARLLTGLLRPVFRTPAQGAETSIWAACSPELEGVSGRYLLNSRIGQSSPLSHDRRLQAELWEASCRLTGPSEEAA